MKLRYKLILALLVVAATPLALAGYQAFLLSRNALSVGIRELLAKTSRAEAEILSRDVSELVRSLKLSVETFKPNPESLIELSEALTRIYLLSDRFNAVALYTAGGTTLGPIIFVDDRKSFAAEYQAHEELDPGELAAFQEQARTLASRADRPTQGPIYGSARKQVPLFALAVPFQPVGGAAYTLVVEVSLDKIQRRFEGLRVGATGFAFGFDSQGRLAFHPVRARALRLESLRDQPPFARLLGSSNSAVVDYRDPAIGPVIGSYSPVPETGWALMVIQPAGEALGPIRELLAQLIAWLLLGLALAGLLGMFLASRITQPVYELVGGAQAIARGELGTQLRIRRRDELGQLGLTFNHMGDELKRKQTQIEAQNEEIRRWNAELQQRVEDRTQELHAAQEQLLQAKKLAAMGELGAGVAHEINNPLMGVLGCAQFLLMRHGQGDPDFSMLRDIESEAKRIRDIVASLLQVSQTGEAGQVRVHLGVLIPEVLEALRPDLANAKVQVEIGALGKLPPILADPVKLTWVFTELVKNAMAAMPEGGKISISAHTTDDGLLAVEVADTGIGIPADALDRIFEPFFTSKQNWQGRGLGLTTVFNILKHHQARIQVRSESGSGAKFTLTFPPFKAATHLR